MKTVTSGYKTALKTFGRQISAKVSYDEIVLDSTVINNIKPTFASDILKTSMKSVIIDSNSNIPLNTVITVEFGVLVSGVYEYINYGDYIVYKSDYNADTESYVLTCHDLMLKTMIDVNDSFIQGLTYPITVRDYIIAICEQIPLTFADSLTEFTNYNTQITQDVHSGIGYTYRDIFDEISAITGSIICINDNNELTLKYINETSEIIDEESLKDSNISIKEKYGPINSVVFSRASSDNIFEQDTDSIALNGLCEIKITDNQLLSGEDRSSFLTHLFYKLLGFEYYIYDIQTIGTTYLELFDKFSIEIGENTYPTILFNDSVEIESGLSETMYVEMPTQTSTEYKFSSNTDKSIKKATIIVDKQLATISAEVSSNTNSIGDLDTKTTNLEISVDGINETIEKNKYYIDDEGNKQLISSNLYELTKTVDGIDLQLTQTGGSNLIYNSVGYFGNDDWAGEALSYTDTEIKNNTISQNAFLLQNATLGQTIQVKNGSLTLSFLYKKLLPLASCQLVVNEQIIELTSETFKNETITFEVSANTVEISLISDTDNACYVSDLMLNYGTLAQIWSNNPSESVKGGVKIGSGIEITSSASNIKQTMDNDGNRIINTNTGETVSEFTDKGMEAKEVKAEKGEIAKVLVVNMGTQTWLSRL